MDKQLPSIKKALKSLGAKKASSIMRGAIQKVGNAVHKQAAADGAKGTGLSNKDARRRTFRWPHRQRRNGWGRVRVVITQQSSIVPIARWNVSKKKNGDLKVKPRTPTAAKPNWSGRDRYRIKSKFRNGPAYTVRSKDRRGDETTVHADADFADSVRFERFARRASAMIRKDIVRRLQKEADKAMARAR